MRHGLIPNLLDPARFNCRDATFFFVKGIVDYISETNDYDILKTKIEMKFLVKNFFLKNLVKFTRKTRGVKRSKNG